MAAGIYKGSRSITKIFYGRHRGEVFVDQLFSYTGADQHFTIPAGSTAVFEVNGAGSRSAKGGKSTGKKYFAEQTELSIVVGARGNNGNGGKYGFSGGANGGSNAAGGGLSGVFTGSAAVGNNDGARALIVAGGAGGSSAGTGGAGGGTTGGTGTGSCGNPGAGGTQTGRGSGGNAGSGQFGGGGGSGTYGYGGGGGRWGGNGSQGDGSVDDDKGGGGGSGYVGRVDEGVTTQGGGSAAGVDGSVKISYTIPSLIPTEYVEGWLGNTQIFPGENEGRLPREYQEVEYIESSGTGCGINTGIIPHNTTFFEIEFKMNPTTLKSSGNYFYGTDSSGAWNSFEYTSGNGSYWNVGSSTLIGTLSPNLSTGTNYIFDCKYSGNNGGTLTVSGTYSKSVSYSGSTGTNTLYFFCSGNTLNAQSAEKLYYIKIYTGSSEGTKTLVRDFVPCYRKSDGVIGLYDLVNDVFYTNSGTGSFTKGPDVIY